MAAEPVLAIVTVAVRPVFQEFTRYVTRQPPTGGLDVGGLLVGGFDVGGWLVGRFDAGGLVGCVVVTSPKNWIAISACPLSGRLCPTPAMLIASTVALVAPLPLPP